MKRRKSNDRKDKREKMLSTDKPEGQDLTAILARVDRRRAILGLSDRAASQAAGASPDLIRSARKQLRMGKQDGFSGRSLHGLAVALKTNFYWLTYGKGDEELFDEPTHVWMPNNKKPMPGQRAGRMVKVSRDIRKDKTAEPAGERKDEVGSAADFLRRQQTELQQSIESHKEQITVHKEKIAEIKRELAKTIAARRIIEKPDEKNPHT